MKIVIENKNKFKFKEEKIKNNCFINSGSILTNNPP